MLDETIVDLNCNTNLAGCRRYDGECRIELIRALEAACKQAQSQARRSMRTAWRPDSGSRDMGVHIADVQRVRELQAILARTDASYGALYDWPLPSE